MVRSKGSCHHDAVEANRKTPQTVTECGYPALETYDAAKVRTEWIDAGTELLVLAHNDPDAVEMVTAHV